MPPWKIYSQLSAACDVDYIHTRFSWSASLIDETLRANFADSVCANAHKKRLITRNRRGG